MSNYEDAITEVYRLLDDLSKKITRNKNEADELLQEVIVQVLEKDKEQILSIHNENKLMDYCAKIMLINYNSAYSRYNYHRLKHRNMCTHHIHYEDFLELYHFTNDISGRYARDEYAEQMRVISYMQQSNDFDTIDVGLIRAYFGVQYNFKEMYNELKEQGAGSFSYGWLHNRLKRVKSLMPENFKKICRVKGIDILLNSSFLDIGLLPGFHQESYCA